MWYCFLFLFLFTGCYKNHIYVRQERIDREYLASSYVHTPDPRQEDPPEGEKILISWDYPLSCYRKRLYMVLTVRLWDHTEQYFQQEIDRRRGIASFFFPEKGSSLPKILTYRIQVYDQENTIVETWEHQFWTPLIDLDEDKVSSAH